MLCFLSRRRITFAILRPSQGGGGGYLFPCSPEINWLVPLFPKNRKFCFLMFPVPQYCLCSPVPLKILPLFPCSPEINTLFPCSPKPLGRPPYCCINNLYISHRSLYAPTYSFWAIRCAQHAYQSFKSHFLVWYRLQYCDFIKKSCMNMNYNYRTSIY